MEENNYEDTFEYSVFVDTRSFGGMFVQFFTITASTNNGLIQPINFITTDFGAFLILLIVSTIIYSLYYQAYINRYYYDCGPDFITIKKGVFAPSEIHVQYQKIQDVYVDQDIFDRMFGLYDVHIASATVTSGIEAHIDGVNADVAENLKNILLGKINGGGSIPTNAQIPSQPAQNVQTETSAQFQSDKTISSTTYPISGSWIYSAMFSSAAFGLIFTLIFGFMSFGFVSRVTGEPLVYIGLWILCNLLFFIFISLIYFVYLLVWKKNFYFEFMPDYILLRTGVLNKEEKHMPYKSIQNVTNSQGIFDRMFGLVGYVWWKMPQPKRLAVVVIDKLCLMVFLWSGNRKKKPMS